MFNHSCSFQLAVEDRLVLCQCQPTVQADIAYPDRIRNLETMLRSIAILIYERDALKRRRVNQAQNTSNAGT